MVTPHQSTTRAETLAIRLENLQAPPPEAPVICIKTTAAGTTLAIARYQPHRVSAAAAASIIRAAVHHTPPALLRWQTYHQMIKPGHWFKPALIVAVPTALGTALLLEQTAPGTIANALVGSIAGALAGHLAAVVKVKKIRNRQREAAAEITRRLNGHWHLTVPPDYAATVHRPGVTLIAFPPGVPRADTAP